MAKTKNQASLEAGLWNACMYCLEKMVAEKPLLSMRFASFFANQNQIMLALRTISIAHWIGLILQIQSRSMHC